MDALQALHTRNSVNMLTEPGPNADQLKNILKSGLRACDHKRLRPWKYLLIEGKARSSLGDLFVSAKIQDEPMMSEEAQAKLHSKPMRAPLIIVVIADMKIDPAVPEIEQILSAGASAQMMMVAAHAQGIGAIWRSGPLMFDARIHQGLNLSDQQQIIGFLYLGTTVSTKRLPENKLEDFVQHWQG